MNKIVYPLAQVLEIKKKRVQDAERVLREKIDLLEKEKEKLLQKEKERDLVLKHKKDKLQQLRHEMDQRTTTTKIQQMKNYLKVVDEKLAIEEKKVQDQKAQVKKAEKEVEDARQQLKLRRLEVDKLNIHKSDWEKIARKEMEIIEEREMDELGNVLFHLHHRENV